MRLISYARCSTTEQAEGGTTLSAQVEKCRGYAEIRGDTIVLEVQDAAISGSVPAAERPGFAQALEMLQRGKADGIVAVSLDRISRGAIDMMGLSQRFNENGWSLISIRDPIDCGTATGRLMLGILSVFAQFERELIGERTKAGLLKRKREGKRVSGWIPWGSRLVGTDLEPAPEELALGEQIKAWRLAGRSACAMADLFNERGTPYPRSGRRWSRHDVETVVRAMQSAGKIERKFQRKRKSA